MIIRKIDILLVEDNLGDVELIREALNFSNIINPIYVVENGEQALDFLFKKGIYADQPTPDLVILDINLPKKSGHEVLTEIRASSNLSYLPVIVLTTSNQELDIEQAYKKHVNAFITKPARATEMIKAVRAVEQFWLNLAKLPRRA